MSFLDESDFDGPRRDNNNNNRQNINGNDDDDLSNQFGNRVNLGTPSGSRARMLAQEREKQLKRRQNSAQNEGMIRSSLSPAVKSQGQFTPAIRQFSAPKNVKGNFEDDDDDNGEDENIERLAASATRGKPLPRGKSNQNNGGSYDDDDDDDDRYNPRRDNNNNAKLKVINRQNGEDNDDNNYTNNGTKSDKMAAQIAAHHTRVMKFASDANEPNNSFNNNNNSNNRSNYTSNQNNNQNNHHNPSSQSHHHQPAYNKGSYRDEDDDDDDDMNGNDDYNNNNNSSNNKNRQNTRYVAPPSQAPPLGKRSNNNSNSSNNRNSNSNDNNDGEVDNWATSKNNQTNNNNNNNNRNQNNNSRNSNHNNNNNQNDNNDDDDEEEEDDDDDDEDEGEESGHGTKNTLSSDTLSKSIHVVPLDLSDMREFLMSPVPRGSGIVQCYIKRNKVGVNKLFPVYSLYLKEPNRFLMASKKRPNNKTSNYLISMNEGDLSRDGNNYLGKLRSNFVGTEFQIFDNGINPKESGEGGGSSSNHHDHNSEVRKEMGAVIYAANVLGSRGPRKMQVAIPGVDENNNSSAFHQSLSLARSSSLALTANSASSFSNRPGSATPKRRSSFSRFVTGVTGGSGGDSASGGDSLSNGEDILARIKDKNFKDLGYFINKPPRWNDQVGAYVLNFNGRVTMASVKNFQLVDPDEINDVTLQFGRVGKDDFTMDLQWPMSPFQAFAITLSSFDSKIACD